MPVCWQAGNQGDLRVRSPDRRMRSGRLALPCRLKCALASWYWPKASLMLISTCPEVTTSDSLSAVRTPVPREIPYSPVFEPVVPPAGIEPATYRLEGGSSIR
jgi:hypothetical protein